MDPITRLLKTLSRTLQHHMGTEGVQMTISGSIKVGEVTFKKGGRTHTLEISLNTSWTPDGPNIQPLGEALQNTFNEAFAKGLVGTEELSSINKRIREWESKYND